MASSGAVTIQNVGARLHIFCGKRVIPGETVTLTADEFKRFEKSPVWRAGKELKLGAGHKMPPVTSSLAKADLDQARSLIETEKRAEVLQAWGEKEDRPEVLRMISDRIKKL